MFGEIISIKCLINTLRENEIVVTTIFLTIKYYKNIVTVTIYVNY